MHSRLEDYLTELTARFAPLPAARRDDELREMRQHLLNAVAVNQELGQSETEATRTALEQFGTPQELGENVVRAWRRERTLRLHNCWGAAAATPTVLFLLFFLLGRTLDLTAPLTEPFFLHHRAYVVPFVDGEFTAIFILTGALVGSALPRMAVRGVSLGLVIFTCIWHGMGGDFSFPTEAYQYIAWAKELTWLVAALSSAWAASRCRSSRLRRSAIG